MYHRRYMVTLSYYNPEYCLYIRQNKEQHVFDKFTMNKISSTIQIEVDSINKTSLQKYDVSPKLFTDFFENNPRFVLDESINYTINKKYENKKKRIHTVSKMSYL